MTSLQGIKNICSQAYESGTNRAAKFYKEHPTAVKVAGIATTTAAAAGGFYYSGALDKASGLLERVGLFNAAEATSQTWGEVAKNVGNMTLDHKGKILLGAAAVTAPVWGPKAVLAILMFGLRCVMN